MANKHAKRDSTLYVLREIQINTSEIPWHTYENSQNPGHCYPQTLGGCGRAGAHSLLAGPQHGAATSEDKTKHGLTIQLSYRAPPNGAENLCPQKTLPMDVYDSFVHNCRIMSLEAAKMPFSG